MGVDEQGDTLAPRERELRRARQLGTIAGRAGHHRDTNPWKYPHEDRALCLIWAMAWVEAGGPTRKAKAKRVLTKLWLGGVPV